MYLSPMGPPKRVTIVDVEKGHEVAGEIPFADSVRPPALSADNRLFFQHVDGLVGFQVADIAQRKVIATVRHEVPAELAGKSSRSHGLAIRPDQKELWSCDVEHKLVFVHDLTKPEFPQTQVIPMIGRVYWLCFSPDGKFCYVAVLSERKTCVVDCETKKVVSHIDVGNGPKRNLVITRPGP
jgi:DNA-binding beta-propeller fold protein YncE